MNVIEVLIGQSQREKTHSGAEGCHVHLLCLCAHSSLVSEDGLHDECIREDDDTSREEILEDEHENVVAIDLLFRRKRNNRLGRENIGIILSVLTKRC